MYHIKEHVRHWTLTDFCEWSERLELRVTYVEAQYGVPCCVGSGPVSSAKGIVYRVERA